MEVVYSEKKTFSFNGVSAGGSIGNYLFNVFEEA